MAIESILLSYATTLKSGVAYAVPTATVILSWQSPTGSTLEGSLDNVTWGSLGTGGANQLMTVATAVLFIRANTNDTVVSCKSSGLFGSTIITNSIIANDAHFNNFIEFDTNPAQSGDIRLPNNHFIAGREPTGQGGSDIYLIGTDVGGNILIGDNV